MKKYIIIITLLFSIAWNYQSAICRSWSDLDAGEREIYGSEREEKFPVKAFFIEKELWESHYSMMLFWLYKHTDYPRYKSTRFLPFYYGLDSKIDNRSMTILPVFLSWIETDGTEQTSHILFPLYYSSIDKRTDRNESDRELFLLFWWGKKEYSSRIDSYQTILPLSYHSSNFNPASGAGEFLWINPLFVSWREKISEHDEKEHLWWAPVIPLVTFNHVNRYDGHRNIFMLLDYSWDIEKGEDHMRRFWFIPFIFWGRGDDGYTAIIPFYMNNRHGNGDYYYHFLPLFATWKDTGYSYGNKTNNVTNEFLTLLFARRTVTDEKSGEEKYSNFWAPLLPLFFRSSDADLGTHTNVAWLIDWESSKEGSLKSLWIAPFVFHQSGESGYKYYIPFYCRPSGTTDKEGYTFGLFHYYGWRESGSTVWSWLYYSREDFVDKPQVKGSAEPVEKDEFYYTHFIPFYWSWKSTESTGRLILPLIYNYQDRQTNLHVNLLGFAKKTYTGPFNPDISIGLANRNDTWYFDSDYSWLYDVVSISSRVAIRNPFAQKKSGDTDTDIVPVEKIDSTDNASVRTGITGKKGTGRENSEFFWGWKLLFGWMAYEQADTQRHFRLLPLTWFTWDEKANDKLYVFLPLFLSYASEDTKEEYFVVAPFYASQREGKSYAKAYLIDLYWDEYKAENDYYEKTILWPFINWYSSPDKRGFRFFPVVWYKQWTDNGVENSRFISPLFYRKDSTNIETGEIRLRNIINPMYYLSEENNGANTSYSLFAPLLPVFYHGAESNGVTTSGTTITPLFYYYNEETRYPDGIQAGSTFWVPVLPLFYKHNSGTYSHWNLLGLLDSCRDRDYSRFFFLPFYYSTEEKGESHHNIAGIIDWWSGENGTNTSMVFPLYRWSGDEKSSSLVLFPLLSYFGRGPDGKTRFIAGAYWHESQNYERQNFLYLFDHRKYTGSGYNFDRYSMLFTTMQMDISPEVREMRLLWGTLLNYKNYRNSENYDIDAVLWLAGIERSGTYFHNRVLPLYWYSSDTYETHLVVPPVLSYFSKDQNGNFDLGLLGLVYYRNENRYAGKDRLMWLLGSVYSEVRVPERKYHSMGSLWGILWDYETEGETGFTKLTILKGIVYKYINDKGETKHTVLGVF